MRLNGAGQFGRLSGGQFKSFRAALLDAFPTESMLDQMPLIYLHRNRQRSGRAWAEARRQLPARSWRPRPMHLGSNPAQGFQLGVPMAAIVARLERNGLAHLLNQSLA